MTEVLGVRQMYYPHLAMTTLLWLTVPAHSDGQRHAVGEGGRRNTAPGSRSV